jgi:hypothetical protein
MYTTGLSAMGTSRLPRRFGKVFIAALLVLLMQVSLVASASAVEKVAWTGSFTGAYADNPTPVVTESTLVTFEVSRQLNDSTTHGASIRVFNDAGTHLKGCTTGSSCVVGSNPAPGTSVSYYAELWVIRDGVYVKHSTSSSVTVTDPGWDGSFTGAYADNPRPVLGESTLVTFQVDAVLSSASIRVFNDAGTHLKGCTTGSSCVVGSNPAPGTSVSYYAELWVIRDGVYVKHSTSSSVTVTDPGWTGSFTSAESVAGEYEFLGVPSALFTWDEPLQYAWIDIIGESGDVIGTCASAGALKCSAGVALGPEESQAVHAEARVHGSGGGYVTIATSGSVELTGMDADAFASFLLSAPESALVALLGDTRAAKAVEVRGKQLSAEYCLALGQRYPTHRLGSTVPDLTLLCSAGKVGLLAWLIVEVGVDGALDMISSIDDNPGTDADPAPEPEPAPQPPGGGGGDDPPPVVDTCQLPSGPDPDVFYFYQRQAQADEILSEGVRKVGPQGKIWLAGVLYSTAADAQAELALPDPAPDGYFEVPRDRLGDLYGPYCVDPAFGQPGGGIEYWTTQEINMEGLTWHPMQ